jgi:dipeptidyl aminopeptidase/acylaminoacyl peptidase
LHFPLASSHLLRIDEILTEGKFMMLRSLCLLALSALVLSVPLDAQEWLKAKELPAAPVIPAKVFAQLGRMSGPDVTPDGTHLAYVTSVNGRKHVAIKNLVTGKIRVISPGIKNYEFRWVGWANDNRLLIGLGFEADRGGYFEKTRETRLISANRDGTDLKNVILPNELAPTGSKIGRADASINAVVQDDVIDWTPGDPDTVLISIYENYESLSAAAVRKVNVVTGAFDTLMTGQRNINRYTTDTQGIVRMGWGTIYSGNKIDGFLSYQNPDTGKWQKFAASPLLEDGTDFAGFMTDPRFAYAYAPVEGRRALVKFDMRTQTVTETIFRDQDTDVESVFYNDKREAIGVRLAGGKDVFFDPVWQKRRAGLEKIFKDYEITITTISLDGNYALIRATSPREPGIRYLYDVTSKSVKELDFDYIELGPDNAPYRTKINYKARDGLNIEAIITLPRGIDPKNLPTIILPHGGPWAQDEVNYDYEAAFLANRGYAVLQPNFRGSTGYGKAFLDKGNSQWGLSMQDDITDGAEWLIKNGIADKSRMCIVGGSYGGYAALMGAVKTPDLFKCAASVNGVSDIIRLLRDDYGTFKSESSARVIGDPNRDRERLKVTSPINNVDKIKAPILLIHAKDDLRVDIKQSYRMRDKLKDAGKSVEFVEITDGEHWLENEAARITYLTALEGFLSKHLGQPGS